MKLNGKIVLGKSLNTFHRTQCFITEFQDIEFLYTLVNVIAALISKVQSNHVLCHKSRVSELPYQLASLTIINTDDGT